MRKLGGIEDSDAFILAIAGGADVNGTWQGDALVVHFFVEALRQITFTSPAPAGAPTDPNVIKLDALVKSGADLTPVFENTARDWYEFGNAVRLVSRRIELLHVLLESDQAEKMVRTHPAHKGALLELYQYMGTMMIVLKRLLDA